MTNPAHSDDSQQSTPPSPPEPQYAPPQYAAPRYAPPQATYALPPAHEQQPAPVIPSSGDGTAPYALPVISMISSIVGFFSFAILSFAGTIMGHIALSRIKRTGAPGRGMAITALVVGYVGIAIWAVLSVIVLIVVNVFTSLGASGIFS